MARNLKEGERVFVSRALFEEKDQSYISALFSTKVDRVEEKVHVSVTGPGDLRWTPLVGQEEREIKI